MRTPLRLAPLCLLLALVVPARAAESGGDARPLYPPPVLGGAFRYWAFTGANDLRDVLVYWVPGPFHLALETWDFVHGEDQFRPEAGLHLRDPRRSSYTLQARHEGRQDRFWAGTEQVLARGFVARAEVSPVVAEDGTSWVADGGLDYYWGSYHYASATALRDPRDGGIWVFPTRLRIASESNDWIQATVAPAAGRHTWGWALETKLRILRLGVERNNRYDFTSLDNVIVTVGLETPLPR